MPPRKKTNGPSELSIGDYRHPDATRKNIPPAKIAAEGQVPQVPKIQYSYNIRADAAESVKFYASNNVFTGALNEAFVRLSKKLIKP